MPNISFSFRVIELKGQIKAMRGDTVYEGTKIGTGASGTDPKKTRQGSRDKSNGRK